MSLRQRKREIVTRIQQFDPVSIVLTGVRLLHKLTGDLFPTPEKLAAVWQKNHKPWHVMLLVQWAMQHRKRRCSTRRIDPKEFHNLCVDVAELSESDEVLKKYKGLHPYLVLMQMRPQQFAYQFRPEEIPNRIARHLIWFVSMDEGEEFFWKFAHATKIPPELFLGMCLWCHSFMQDGKFSFTPDMFVDSRIPNWAITRFFDKLSVDLERPDGFPKKHDMQKATTLSQVVDPSPLAKTPFFLYNGRHTLFSPAMFAHEMQHIAYRILHSYDASYLGENFGPIFEKYVGMGFRHCCETVWDGDQIKKHVGKKRKCVDFFVKEGSAAIFADAKCTELPSFAKVTESPCALIDYSDRLIHGMKQVLSTCARFLEKKTIRPDAEIFGLVVTNGNYFLTKEILDKCTDGKVDRILADDGHPELVDKVRFLFVDIESFDYLVAGAKENETRLATVLTWVSDRNKENYINSPLFFKEQLLRYWDGRLYVPNYLQKALNNSVKTEVTQ